MANFTFTTLIEGYENKNLTCVTALVSILFEEDDCHVVVPSQFNNLPVTHVCFTQGYEPAHEHWHDWHHPTAYGSEWVDGKYSAVSAKTIEIPCHVQTLTLPSTTTHVGNFAFSYSKKTTVLLPDENPHKKSLAPYLKSCK